MNILHELRSRFRTALQALGADELGIRVGAVCVYHAMVPTAVKALDGSGIPVAAVAAGTPGMTSTGCPGRSRVASATAGLASTMYTSFSRVPWL